MLCPMPVWESCTFSSATERDEARWLSAVSCLVLELAFARQVASTDVKCSIRATGACIRSLHKLSAEPLPPSLLSARFLTSAISHRSTGQATPTVSERRLTLNALWWRYREQREDPTKLNGGNLLLEEFEGGQFACSILLQRYIALPIVIFGTFGILCIERYIYIRARYAYIVMKK